MGVQAPTIEILHAGLWIRNSEVRIPFRYGKACLTKCPQAVLRIDLRVNGSTVSGFSGDCLPPSWFDKTPGKSYELQICEMIEIIEYANQVAVNCGHSKFWPLWREVYTEVQSEGGRRNLPELLSSFGIALVERALIDGIGRALGTSFFDLMKLNMLGMRAADIHPELEQLATGEWLPEKPSANIAVRHTVGLSDPLTRADIAGNQHLNDGRPESLEEYIEDSGIHFLKVKVRNVLELDLQRICTIATLIERRHGEHYSVTLDGNEQYDNTACLGGLLEAIQGKEHLRVFWNNVLLIEQPFNRTVAMSEKVCSELNELTSKKIIIDESDGKLESYKDAYRLGYRGVSSKACKGAVKSVLNAGLVHLQNKSDPNSTVMTGEDLCCVGMVSLQQDLALVSSLGLSHVEKNGHHYHPGLCYLGDHANWALQDHETLYEPIRDVVSPKIVDGRFNVTSLNCAGFGVERMHSLDGFVLSKDWKYSSLDISD